MAPAGHTILLKRFYTWKGLFLLPLFSLIAFATTVNFMFLYNISSTSNSLKIHPTVETTFPNKISKVVEENRTTVRNTNHRSRNSSCEGLDAVAKVSRVLPCPFRPTIDISDVNKIKDDVFHDKKLFMKYYKEMNKTLKIYAYSHDKHDPFANVLLPVGDDFHIRGNYASETYFKRSLIKSHFLTNDPSEAHLFYMPFSISNLRNDKRVGVGGIQDFVRDYVANISRRYPFWNQSGGADHFYVACHSVGRTAMEKAIQVKLNAIQVVCSSSYFLAGYVSHKDVSIPQIWPRTGSPQVPFPSQRKQLAFYAGAMNSKVRAALLNTWGNDTEISVHSSRLKTPYSEALMSSKFCIHAKGFEVNTARIGDAIYYGCVPVILADHYDLPYADILNWKSFSVVISTTDIPMLKEILLRLSLSNEYMKLQRNVIRVRKHFHWHKVPVDYDTFHMVMKELWLRRSHVKMDTI